jgi:3-phenylpropionate/trans-cinnamate dioxygenase ferredoxin reductase subunit
MSAHTVILGAGQAAAQVAASLRQEGYTGDVTLIGEEPYPPYQRPPLSKAYLMGEFPEDRLFLRPPEFWTETRCDLRLNVRALSVDRASRLVSLSQGSALSYTDLVFATGSRVRKLPLPGADLPGVLYLRGIADIDALKPRMVAGQHLAVIGAGYIGLEAAAVARKLGLLVSVFEMADRVLARVASPPLSAFFQTEHSAHGVSVHTGAQVRGFAPSNGRIAVDSSAGMTMADTVLIGAGILPNQEVAQAAGVVCDNGIVVDAFGRTSDPHISACGDCANLATPFAPARLRLESVQNAIDQAKHVAAAIAGKPKPYADVPWFWSDQYDLKLQIAGVGAAGDTHVVRGDPKSRSFAVFHLRDGVVAAVEAVNAAPEYMMGRRLIAGRARIPPERLADRAVSMKEMI